MLLLPLLLMLLYYWISTELPIRLYQHGNSEQKRTKKEGIGSRVTIVSSSFSCIIMN